MTQMGKIEGKRKMAEPAGGGRKRLRESSFPPGVRGNLDGHCRRNRYLETAPLHTLAGSPAEWIVF